MKKTKLLLFANLIIFIYLCSVKCVSNTELTSAIEPPFEKIDVAYQEFIINASEGAELTLENGTKIHIPPLSFVDENGREILGGVVLKYREFHSAADVLASGIPMEFSENGENGYLATAGMIELQGQTLDGKTIKIAENKEIGFDLASNLETEGVDFYDLDEQTGQWTKTGKPIETPNLAINALKDSLEKLEKIKAPFKPKERSKEEPVVRFMSKISDVDLSGMGNTVWRYAGTEAAFDPFKYENFNKGNYKVTNTQLIDKELQTLQVEITFDSEILDSPSTDPMVLTTWFAPVLNNAEFENAMALFSDKEALFNQLLEQKNRYKEMLANSARVSRAFSINDLGIFNCDVFSREAAYDIPFRFTQNGTSYTESTNMFLVHSKNQVKTVIKLNISRGENHFMKLMQEGENTLVLVLPGDKIKIFDHGQTQKFIEDRNKTLDISIDNSIELKDLKELANLI